MAAVAWRGRRPYPGVAGAGLALLFGLAAAGAVRVLGQVHASVPLTAIPRHLLAHESTRALVNVAMAVRDLVVPGPVVFWRLLPAGASVASASLLAVFLLCIGWLWARFIRGERLAGALLTAWFGASLASLVVLSAGAYAYSERYVAAAPAIIGLCAAVAAAQRTLLGRVSPDRAAAVRRIAGMAVVAYVSVHAGFAVAGTAQCRNPRTFFSAMAAANPTDVIPLCAWAETLNEWGTAEEMELTVSRVTALDARHSKVPLLHNLLVKRYLNDGRYRDALRCADRSIEIYPGDPDKLALRAAAQAYLGNPDGAIQSIRQAIRAAPGNAAYRTLEAQIEANREGTNALR